jgi:predicted RNase H-like nuclease
MRYAKKTGAGENDRIARSAQRGISMMFLEKVLGELRSGRDDFIDAWTARRVFDGTAKRLPSNATRDSRGLDVAMWF